MHELTRIEPATLEDLPLLTELLMDLFAQESDFRPDYANQMRGLRLILEQPSRGRIFVLRSPIQIIGMINLNWAAQHKNPATARLLQYQAQAPHLVRIIRSKIRLLRKQIHQQLR